MRSGDILVGQSKLIALSLAYGDGVIVELLFPYFSWRAGKLPSVKEAVSINMVMDTNYIIATKLRHANKLFSAFVPRVFHYSASLLEGS